MISADEDVFLTSYNNPISPFGDDFESWFKYDVITLNLNTCVLLYKETCPNKLASDEVNDLYLREAMERIVKRYPSLYQIVHPSDYKNGRRLAIVGGS